MATSDRYEELPPALVCVHDGADALCVPCQEVWDRAILAAEERGRNGACSCGGFADPFCVLHGDFGEGSAVAAERERLLSELLEAHDQNRLLAKIRSWRAECERRAKG